jgi:hypothetical protein
MSGFFGIIWSDDVDVFVEFHDMVFESALGHGLDSGAKVAWRSEGERLPSIFTRISGSGLGQ